MVSREVRASLDLRHYGGDAGDLRFPDHVSPEARPDDAGVVEDLPGRQLSVGVEEGEARGGAAPARRAVYLAVGEDGDVALGEAGFFGVLEEDGAVDVPQPGLQGVRDLRRGVQVVLYSRPSSTNRVRLAGSTARPKERASTLA